LLKLLPGKKPYSKKTMSDRAAAWYAPRTIHLTKARERQKTTFSIQRKDNKNRPQMKKTYSRR